MYPNTIITKSVNLEKLLNPIRRLLMNSEYTSANLGIDTQTTLFFITGYERDNEGKLVTTDIPNFTLPLLVYSHDIEHMVIDLRPHIRSPKKAFDIEPKTIADIPWTNEIEGMLAIQRGVLSEAHYSGNNKQLLVFSKLPAVAFSKIIADGVSSRFNLDEMERDKVTVLAYVYYHDLLLAKDKRSEDDINSIVSNIVLNMRSSVKADDVYNILDTHSTPMKGIEDLVDMIKAVLNNVTVDRILNTGTLFTSLSNTWYGYDNKFAVALALEYPPYWISIVTSTLLNKSMKRTRLFTVLDSAGLKRKYKHDNYIKSYNSLLEDLMGD